jgi:hypothetical protein
VPLQDALIDVVLLRQRARVAAEIRRHRPRLPRRQQARTEQRTRGDGAVGRNQRGENRDERKQYDDEPRSASRAGNQLLSRPTGDPRGVEALGDHEQAREERDDRVPKPANT